MSTAFSSPQVIPPTRNEHGIEQFLLSLELDDLHSSTVFPTPALTDAAMDGVQSTSKSSSEQQDAPMQATAAPSPPAASVTSPSSPLILRGPACKQLTCVECLNKIAKGVGAVNPNAVKEMGASMHVHCDIAKQLRGMKKSDGDGYAYVRKVIMEDTPLTALQDQCHEPS